MLEVLSNAVTEVVETDVQSLDDVLLNESLFEITRQIHRLQAAQAQQMAEWEVRSLWTDDGSRNAATRFARDAGVSVAQSKRMLRRGKRVKTMSVCAHAFRAGDISTEQFDLLADANAPGVSEVFARDENVLLDSVRSLRFAEAARLVRYWSQLADEHDAEEKADRQVRQRSASVSKTFEGTVDLRAVFDPVNGEIFMTELERIEQIMFEADWAQARDQWGEAATTSDLERTPLQRRADALVEMAKRSASAEVQNIKARPLISVVVDQKTFGRVCELASGTIVTPGQVVPLLAQAQIESIVFDNNKRIIDVSRKRLFTGALRRALQIRDRHCQHASGCDVPADKCEADHTIAYAAGGETSQTNGQLLCGFHNRAKGSGPP